jgi:peptide deformylase
MSVLKILEVPNPLLKQRSEPVEEITPEIQKTLDDMLETMYQANGVGLAAPQVGILKRMLVIDAAGKDEEPNPVFVVNPEITKKSEELQECEEGCLSVPNQYAKVVRPAAITVEYLNKNGEKVVADLDGFMAVVFQHEIDHLDGILYVDHLSSLKRKMLLKKLEKERKENQ